MIIKRIVLACIIGGFWFASIFIVPVMYLCAWVWGVVSGELWRQRKMRKVYGRVQDA